MASIGVDWNTVLSTREEDLYNIDEEEVDGLYAFLLATPVSSISGHVKNADSLLKILSVSQALFKMKDKEAQELITALETSQQSQQRQPHSYSSGREVMVLRQEVDELRRELSDHRRLLDIERREKEQLGHDLSEERRSTYDLQQKIDQHEDEIYRYREHLGREKGSSGWELLEEQLRKKLWEMERENADQLDQIERLIGQQDELQREKEELLVLLDVKEQLYAAASTDVEKRQQALEEASSQIEELQRLRSELESEKADLMDRHQQLSAAHSEVVELFRSRTKQHEVQLSSKEEEVNKLKEILKSLDSQLRLLQKDKNKASLLRMTKQLAEKEAHIEQLQQELAQAADDISSLSHQLEDARHKADPNHIDYTLQREKQKLVQQHKQLEIELAQEQKRRLEAEQTKEEREKDLVELQQQLERYEEGTFGLRDAVREIKQKKEEISIRDSDIVRLTRQVTVLQGQADLLMEQNDALRQQLGMGPNDSVDLRGLREKREQEGKRLREHNTALLAEVEKLNNEKIALRKKIVDQALALSVSVDKRSTVDSSARQGHSDISELKSKISQLESQLESEQQRKAACEKEIVRLNGQLQAKEVKQQIDTEATDGRMAHDKGALSSQPVEARSQNAHLHTKLRDMEEQKRCLEAELRQRSAENVTLQNQLRSAPATKSSGLTPLHVSGSSLSSAVMMSSTHLLSLAGGGSITPHDIVPSLQEQLLLMIQEVRTKEVELARCQQSLDKMSQKFSIMIHQQGILYKEHQEREVAWEKEREEMKKAKEEMVDTQLQQEVKLQEFKELQDTLAGGSDVVKQRLVELTRRVTILKVNERILSRRFSLLQLRETMLRKENGQLRDQNTFRESAVTKRIGFLERYKEAMSYKLSQLQRDLSHSVPVTVLEEANTKYAQLVCKYQALLQQTGMEEEKKDDLYSGGRVRKLAWMDDESALAGAVADPLPHSALESQVKKLEQTVAGLRAENARLKESVEIANHQLVLVEGRRGREELEETALRHQLEELQVLSERNTNIAKLQQQLLTLQVSEGVALRNVEEGRSRELQLQSALLSCQQQCLEKDVEMSKVKIDFATRIRCLRTFIQTLRRMHMGCVKLDDQEEFSRLVQQKKSGQLELKRLLAEAEEERDAVREQREQLAVQQTNLQDLISASKDSRSAAARLTECHSKLGELRLKEMRYERQTRKMGSQLKQVENLLAMSEQNCVNLEERLAQATEALEACVMSEDDTVAEQGIRMHKLTAEPRARELEDAKHRIAQLGAAVSTAEAEVARKNQSLSELQHRLRVQQDLSPSRDELETARQRISQLETAARQTEEELMRKDTRLMELQQQLAVAGDDRSWREREDELRQVLQLANDTVNHLKSQLAHKESQVEKYHQLMQKSRIEHQVALETHMEETKRLRIELKEQQKREQATLQSELYDSAVVPSPVVTEQHLDRLKELEGLVLELRQTNSSLSQQMEQLKKESRTHKGEWKKESDQMKRHVHKLTSTHKHQVKELEGLVSTKTAQVENLAQENDQLKQEVEGLKQEVEMVNQLRADMREKEQQLTQLLEALQHVRSDLVETVQQTLECHDNSQQAQDDFQQVIKDKIREIHREREVRKDLETQLALAQQTKTQTTRTADSLREQLQESEKDCRLLKQSLVEMSRKNQLLNKEVAKLQDSLPDHTNELQKLRTQCGVLQAKVEKQQKELLEARQQREARRLGSNEVAMQLSPKPVVQDEHSKVHVARWEEGKRWQKRMDTLKEKLRKKTTELEAAMMQISILEERVTRFNSQRSLLHGRLGGGNKTEDPIRKALSAGSVSAEEAHSLRTQVFNLQTELSRLHKQLQPDRNCTDLENPSQTLLANKQLEEANTALKLQIDQLIKQHGEREGEWSVLMEREDSLREQLLSSNKENIRLQFLLDQTTLELERLQSRVTDQEHLMEALKELGGEVPDELLYVEGRTKTKDVQKKFKPHHAMSNERNKDRMFGYKSTAKDNETKPHQTVRSTKQHTS